MWFLQHCLSGACTPHTNAELAEWVLAADVAFCALLGGFCALLGALEWLEGRL